MEQARLLQLRPQAPTVAPLEHFISHLAVEKIVVPARHARQRVSTLFGANHSTKLAWHDLLRDVDPQLHCDIVAKYSVG